MRKFKDLETLQRKLDKSDLSEDAKKAVLLFHELTRRKPHKTANNSYLETKTYREVAELFLSRYHKEVCPIEEAYLLGSALKRLDSPYDFQHDIDILVIRSPENQKVHYGFRTHRNLYDAFGDVVDCTENHLDFETELLKLI